MKKLLLCFTILCSIFVTTKCYAFIDKSIDDFDETIKIYSVQQNVGEFTQFNFIKKDESLKKEYLIYADTEKLKQYNFDGNLAEIKINNDIKKMDVVRRENYGSTENGLYPISITVRLTDESIEALKTASKVTLRFHRENGFTDVVQLPDNVLAEWKEVINTEK